MQNNYNLTFKVTEVDVEKLQKELEGDTNNYWKSFSADDKTTYVCWDSEIPAVRQYDLLVEKEQPVNVVEQEFCNNVWNNVTPEEKEKQIIKLKNNPDIVGKWFQKWCNDTLIEMDLFTLGVKLFLETPDKRFILYVRDENFFVRGAHSFNIYHSGDNNETIRLGRILETITDITRTKSLKLK